MRGSLFPQLVISPKRTSVLAGAAQATKAAQKLQHYIEEVQKQSETRMMEYEFAALRMEEA